MAIDTKHFRHLGSHVEAEFPRLAAAVEEAAGEIDALRAELTPLEHVVAELERQCRALAKAARRDAERQDAKVEALEAERDQLRARVEELEDIKTSITVDERLVEMQIKHDARVAELLEANNREVERRRFYTGKGFNNWIENNWDACEALVENRAAVVPLNCPNAEGSNTTIVGVEYWTDAVPGTPKLWARIDVVRIDKPVEKIND